MSGLFSIAGSALRANQQGLAAVSQNIANVNTEGFGRQQVRMSSGVGGNVTAEVERSDSAWAEKCTDGRAEQLRASQAKSNALDRRGVFFRGGGGARVSLCPFAGCLFRPCRGAQRAGSQGRRARGGTNRCQPFPGSIASWPPILIASSNRFEQGDGGSNQSSDGRAGGS